MPEDKKELRLGKLPEAIVQELSGADLPAGKRYLVFDVVYYNWDTDETFEIPPIKYYFA